MCESSFLALAVIDLYKPARCLITNRFIKQNPDWSTACSRESEERFVSVVEINNQTLEID